MLLKKIVNEMLDSRVIQNNNPYVSSVVLIKKKDGTWKMCINYRALNQATIKDRYPIPLIEELLNELERVIVFSKIDFRSGYWLIRMHSTFIAKTTFKTYEDHYEFLVMSFGLINALSTFQSIMNCLFKPYLRKFVFVFCDDILMYNTSKGEHLLHLEIVLHILG